VFGRARRPRVTRLTTRREAGSIILRWDARGGPAVLWRVLRSASGFAGAAHDHTVVGSGQVLVAENVLPGARDDRADPGAVCYYAVFAEDQLGEWRRAATVRLTVDDPRLSRRAEGDFQSGSPRPGWLDAGAVHTAQDHGGPRR
jgi:hypothetical protein